MELYLYKIGTQVPVLKIENAASYTAEEVRTEDGTVYRPLAEDCELSSLPDCSEALREDWRREHPGTEEKQEAVDAAIYVARLVLSGEAVDSSEKRLRASALYPDWTPGSHAAGEYYNAEGQTWECFQAYDNGVYPDIRPGEAAWYTFNRPLHGKSPETARPFVPVQGAHDMYRAGECMIWTDGAVYRCVQDTNFSPADYAAAWERLNSKN